MRRTESSKFSAIALVQDHYDTLRNYGTKRRRPADYLAYLGVPAAIAGGVWYFDGRARNVPDVLAAIAILTGLIFNVFVLIFDLTARATDTLPPQMRQFVDQLADELRANVSYAVLVGIVLTGLLGGVVMFTDTDKPLGRVSTLLVVFAGVHLLLTIFMILKRVRAMFRSFRVRREDPVP
ncbi:hypothetical protein [Micromonospora zhanjiangensis]|uniref:Uncharacterized protein n=1 Tax=Micromonospora zhanjiangensis TaxID=1522057 RepID=A0ABV8KM87_9ACTN